MTSNNDTTIQLKDINTLSDAVSRMLRYTWAPPQQQNDNRNFPSNLETYWNETIADLIKNAGIATTGNSPQCFDRTLLLQALDKRISGDVDAINQGNNARTIAHVLIMSKAVEIAIAENALSNQTPDGIKSIVTEEWTNTVVDACNDITEGKASAIAELPRRIKRDIPEQPTHTSYASDAVHNGNVCPEVEAIVRGYLSGK